MGSNDKISFALSILITCLFYLRMASAIAFGISHLIPIMLRISIWIAFGLYIISFITFLIGTGQNKVSMVEIGFGSGLVSSITVIIVSSIMISSYTQITPAESLGPIFIIVSIIDIICGIIIFFRRGKL